MSTTPTAWHYQHTGASAIPLVGRHHLKGKIKGVLEDSSPLPKVIFLTGEGGIGKTHLLKAVLEMAQVNPDAPAPENISANLKPYRVRRKQLATFCLFTVITIIILGLQVYATFSSVLTVGLIVLAALFAWRVYRSGVKIGWF